MTSLTSFTQNDTTYIITIDKNIDSNILESIFLNTCVKYQIFTDNREFIIQAIKVCNDTKKVIEQISNEYMNDREVIMTAVKRDANILEYASDELKNDHEIVMTAVIENGDTIEYASDELKNDRDIVMTAVTPLKL